MDLSVEQRFATLADVWRNETAMLSSPTQAMRHPAYWEIIRMGLNGEPVVPLILRNLEETGADWFFALEAITKARPVAATNRRNLDRSIEDWGNWGRQQGVLDPSKTSCSSL